MSIADSRRRWPQKLNVQVDRPRRVQDPLRRDGRLEPEGDHAAGYVGGTPPFRTDLYSTCGTLLTHAESIELIDGMGATFTPELEATSSPGRSSAPACSSTGAGTTYCRGVTPVINNDGDLYDVLDVLRRTWAFAAASPTVPGR